VSLELVDRAVNILELGEEGNDFAKIIPLPPDYRLMALLHLFLPWKLAKYAPTAVNESATFAPPAAHNCAIARVPQRIEIAERRLDA